MPPPCCGWCRNSFCTVAVAGGGLLVLSVAAAMAFRHACSICGNKAHRQCKCRGESSCGSPHPSRTRVSILVHHVAKQRNIGNIVRTAAAVGCDEVLFVGGQKKKSQLQLFGSHGAERYVSIRCFYGMKEAVSYIQSRDDTTSTCKGDVTGGGESRHVTDLVGIEITEDSMPVDDPRTFQEYQHYRTDVSGTVKRHLCFLPGNEGTGLSEQEKRCCTKFVRVRQFGNGTASLNVSCAVGIVLYAAGCRIGHKEGKIEGEKFTIQGKWREEDPETVKKIREDRENKKRIEAEEAVNTVDELEEAFFFATQFIFWQLLKPPTSLPGVSRGLRDTPAIQRGARGESGSEREQDSYGFHRWIGYELVSTLTMPSSSAEDKEGATSTVVTSEPVPTEAVDPEATASAFESLPLNRKMVMQFQGLQPQEIVLDVVLLWTHHSSPPIDVLTSLMKMPVSSNNNGGGGAFCLHIHSRAPPDRRDAVSLTELHSAHSLRWYQFTQGEHPTTLDLEQLNDEVFRSYHAWIGDGNALMSQWVLILGPQTLPQLEEKNGSPLLIVESMKAIDHYNKVKVNGCEKESCLFGCRVLSSYASHLYVMSAGIDAAFGNGREVVFFDRYSGFPSGDARSYTEAAVVLPSPLCFLTKVELIRDSWPTGLDGKYTKRQRLEHPHFELVHELQDEEILDPSRHEAFVNFVLKYSFASSDEFVPRVRMLGTGAAVSSAYPAWSPYGPQDVSEGVPLHSFAEEVTHEYGAMLQEWLELRTAADPNLLNVSVVWDTFCVPCFGFTNEVMHYLRPLENAINVQSGIEASCFCAGTPRSFSATLKRLSERKPFMDRFNAIRDASEDDTGEGSSNSKAGATATTENPSALSTTQTTERELLIWISHKDPGSFPIGMFPGLRRRPDIVVGRAMYEFTKLPSHWLSRQNLVDEIWVPSRFVKWVFEKNGFDPSKLVIIPEPLDVFYFDPATTRKLRLPIRNNVRRWLHASNVIVVESEEDTTRTVPDEKALEKIAPFNAAKVHPVYRHVLEKNTKFLSVFKWEERKAWKVLLKAFFTEFSYLEKVSLYIVAYVYGDSTRSSNRMLQLAKQAHDDAMSELGKKQESDYAWPLAPHIEIISEQLSEDDLVSLYHSVDAFVLPTRGEGWGLPIIQAMSMALPAIATNWSGNTDFMNEENSYLLEFDHLAEVDSTYGKMEGKLWAEPSISHLRKLMRHIHENPKAAKKVGSRAREHVMKYFSEEAIAEVVKDRLAELKRNYWNKRKSGVDAIIKTPAEKKERSGIDALLDDHHLIV